MTFAKNVLITLIAAGLSGCSLFGDDKPSVEGERITVLNNETIVRPDYARDAVKIALPRPHRNNEWSQSGGSSSHLTGHLESGNQLQGFWQSSFGEGTSKRDFLISTPVVAQKVVFTIDTEGLVSAKRLDSGETIWERKVKPVNREDKNIAIKGAGIAAANNLVYITTGFGGVFALDMVTGNPVWYFEADNPIRIAPTAGSDMVLIQTIANKLVALDAQKGTELWHYESEAEGTTMVGGASPAYDEEQDLIVAAFSNGELRAFKASTGSPLWADWLYSSRKSTPMAAINTIKANPVIAGNTVFAAGHSHVMTAIDVRTGNRIWQRDISASSQPWVAGDYMFVVANNSDLIAVENATGRIVWSTKIPLGTEDDNKTGAFISGPVLTDNRLLVTTSTGYAFAVSPYTGKILSYVDLEQPIETSPVVADGITILTTNDAELYAYQ